MKLQVKDSGAWRNVVNFDARQQAAIEIAGAALLRATGCEKTTLRIVDGTNIVAYCEAPAFTWREA